jgi:hypothetical protein
MVCTAKSRLLAQVQELLEYLDVVVSDYSRARVI